MYTKDKQIIHDLARQYMEYALSDRQADTVRRMRAINDLKPVRPPVLLDEIPWFEINIDDELTLCCENDAARNAEWYFRSALYRCRHFKADAILEPFFPIYRAYSSSGIGLHGNEQQLATDQRNHIVSHTYHDVLEDESAAEQIKMPVITAYPEDDAARFEFYSELLDGVMPVQYHGTGSLYFAPWDTLSSLRGVEPILFDMYERPAYLHRLIRLLCDAAMTEMDQIAALGLLDPTVPTVHCTPAYISGMQGDGWKGAWYRGMAQMFSAVSPTMHKEFEVDYIRPLAERCAYTYYGCCEPLDDKIDVIRTIPNLRKVGVSPWANPLSCAEQLGGNFVYARKPNPAHVAIHTDPEVVGAEIEETVKACIAYSCPCEFVLKDISTVSYRPENLILWSQTVSEVLDAYYT